ncbi:MAG TPA: hypothetical protein VFT58_04975 [Nitrososphaera sp.]|jgi:hypothetical protein|nr:hypothetical protein [Nitrososphaera sp.]
MSSSNNNPLGTFILDFQTTTFEPDSLIATDVLSELQTRCELENQYAIDPPLERAGWSFAKIFISGQFVEKIRDSHGYEIERSKGRKFDDRFVAWLASELKKRGCGANIKLAPEMKEL